MARRNEHRVKKLEHRTMNQDNPITEIVVQYIDMDGSVSSSMVKKLINGVWCVHVEGEKSTN